MKIGFGTVVYRESFQYYQEFVESINHQDCHDFDLVFINDNLSDEQLKKLVNSLQKNVVYCQGKPNSSPSELRVQLLKYAKEKGYNLFILGDFDDTFSPNRVRSITSAYDETVSFYYNEIAYLHNQKQFFKSLPQYIHCIDPILEQNCLGLSNTALNLDRISFELLDQLNQKSILAFDWYMYTYYLFEGHVGKKVENCKTYYRIYENNIAGESKNTLEDIHKEINVKINHYTHLQRVDAKFHHLLNYYKLLQSMIDEGKIDILNDIERDNDYWWGRINSTKIRLEREYDGN